MRAQPKKFWVTAAAGMICILLAAFVLGAVIEGKRVMRDLVDEFGDVAHNTTDFGGATTFHLYAHFDGTTGYVSAAVLVAVGTLALLGAFRMRRR